jgi:pimeloyl-ACP methyl ester carboxylesterase
MIAQTLAIDHPDRVRSLTLIGSTPWWRIGREKLATTLRLLRARLATRRLPGARGVEERLVAASRVFGSSGYRLDEAWVRQVARAMHERGGPKCGRGAAANAAIVVSGDRRAALAKVRVPTLVVHGIDAPIVRLAGGQAAASAIPGRQAGDLPGYGPRPARRVVAGDLR